MLSQHIDFIRMKRNENARKRSLKYYTVTYNTADLVNIR